MYGYETKVAKITIGLGNRKLWFPLQASLNLVNSLPQSFKDTSTLKALKVCFKGYIANQGFFDVEEFLTFAWRQLKTQVGTQIGVRSD